MKLHRPTPEWTDDALIPFAKPHTHTLVSSLVNEVHINKGRKNTRKNQQQTNKSLLTHANRQVHNNKVRRRRRRHNNRFVITKLAIGDDQWMFVVCFGQAIRAHIACSIAVVRETSYAGHRRKAKLLLLSTNLTPYVRAHQTCSWNLDYLSFIQSDRIHAKGRRTQESMSRASLTGYQKWFTVELFRIRSLLNVCMQRETEREGANRKNIGGVWCDACLIGITNRHIHLTCCLGSCVVFICALIAVGVRFSLSESPIVKLAIGLPASECVLCALEWNRLEHEWQVYVFEWKYQREMQIKRMPRAQNRNNLFHSECKDIHSDSYCRIVAPAAWLLKPQFNCSLTLSRWRKPHWRIHFAASNEMDSNRVGNKKSNWNFSFWRHGRTVASRPFHDATHNNSSSMAINQTHRNVNYKINKWSP